MIERYGLCRFVPESQYALFVSNADRREVPGFKIPDSLPFSDLPEFPTQPFGISTRQRVSEEMVVKFAADKSLIAIDIPITDNILRRLGSRRLLHKLACVRLRSNESAEIVSIDLSHSEVTDNGLQALTSIASLERVTIVDTDISGTGFASMKPVREIVMSGAALSDEGAEVISQLPNVKVLFIGNAQITDKGWACLSRLSKLQELFCGKSNLSDKSLKYIASLSHLHILSAYGTDLSDESVQTLSGMRQLRRLSIHGTKVSHSGVRQLRTALPQCTVVWESYDGLAE